MTRIYLITPPEFDLPRMAQQLPAVLDAADVACVQLRLKDKTTDEWEAAIETLMPICWSRDIAFIINDRTDLAKRFNADGVHLGKNDMTYPMARSILGKDKIIGVSCYASKDTAMDVAEEGADYVAFGAAFPSTTKEEAPPVPLSVFEDWVIAVKTPCVAIGGITAGNCAPLVQIGVEFVAVIGQVWNHEGGAVAGIKELQKAIDIHKKTA
ncbi:MAG: thiamine phosphate synthase [Alphaproteobacteria bacterium]|nr:thiamine phosphate synthase [Alphaproteobacteria bacterium]